MKDEEGAIAAIEAADRGAEVHELGAVALGRVKLDGLDGALRSTRPPAPLVKERAEQDAASPRHQRFRRIQLMQALVHATECVSDQAVGVSASVREREREREELVTELQQQCFERAIIATLRRDDRRSVAERPGTHGGETHAPKTPSG